MKIKMKWFISCLIVLALTVTGINISAANAQAGSKSVAQAAETSTTYDDKNAALVYSGSWSDMSDSGAYSGSFKKSTAPGSSVTMSFTGTSFSLLYAMNSTFTKMDVFVDGVLIGTIDQYSASRLMQQSWRSPLTFPLGAHTLKLVHTGTDTTTRVSLDAVTIYSSSVASPTPTSQLVSSPTASPTSQTTTSNSASTTFDDKNAALTYSGSWSDVADTGAYSGSFKKSTAPGSSATMNFTGSSVSLIYTANSTFTKMDIFIDGALFGTIDQYSATRLMQQKWTSSTFPLGTHTLKVVHKGTDTTTRVSLDAVIVYSSSVTSASPAPTLIPTNIVSPTPTFIPTNIASPTATVGSTATPLPTNTVAPSGSTYYVAPTGNDANAGTQSYPWKTIQKAANTVSAGATVLVQAGTYNERVAISRSGTSAAPITFQAQGSVVMHGFTVQANYITMRGFEITDTPDSSVDGWGIWVKGSSCLIENNYIHYATRGGILLYAEPGYETLTANCVVRNNRLYKNSQMGIDVRGRNHLIENNEVWGTIQHHPKMANQPYWVDADGMRFHGSGHIFRGNYIHDILYSDPENIDPHIDCFQTFESLPYQEVASNVTFERNRCINAQPRASSGFMLNGAKGITIRNNIIKVYVGINGQNASNLTIVHNTFANVVTFSTAYNPAGITLTGVTTVTIKNNIFYDLPGQLIYLTTTSGLSSGKNLMYRSDGQPLWATTSYSHANDLWGVNPLFVSSADYHLQTGSPAIDAGYDVAVTSDFDSRSRPQGPGYDIGAFEK